ncbi:hypothetical protein ACTFIY_004550 [Dictyostelium cf. discoideum]
MVYKNQELMRDFSVQESLDLLLVTMRSSYGRRLCEKLSPDKQKQFSRSVKGEFPKAFNQVKNYFSSLNKPKEKLTELSQHNINISVGNAEDSSYTVNHYVQAIVEEELERGIIQAEAKSGWAVVIDPKTGYILALAQYPFFFPDHYMDYFNDKEKIARPNAVPSPMQKIPTRSGLFPGRSKPITDVQPYNFLNMYMAVQKSSNIYMANLASRIVRQMGNVGISSMLTSFGFEKKTGIELLEVLRGGSLGKIAQAYRAIKTPQFYLLNQSRTLEYCGRAFDNPKNWKKSVTEELKEAIDALLNGESSKIARTEPIGCTIKWRGKEKHWIPNDLSCDFIP